jgi:hypothetical protein
VFQTSICFSLWLNGYLVGFPHRRCAKYILELGYLLLVVATGLAHHHIGFRFPEANGDALASFAVCQQVMTLKSLQLLGGWYHRISKYADCLIDLTGQKLGKRNSSEHGFTSRIE